MYNKTDNFRSNLWDQWTYDLQTPPVYLKGQLCFFGCSMFGDLLYGVLWACTQVNNVALLIDDVLAGGLLSIMLMVSTSILSHQ